MDNPHVPNSVFKYILLIAGIVLALSFAIAFFLFSFPADEAAVSASRAECQSRQQCECAEAGRDKNGRPLWTCVRPRPTACLFGPGPERKAIDSIRYAYKDKDRLQIADFDLCTGQLSVLAGQGAALDEAYIKALETALNSIDLLHLSERYFPGPETPAKEHYITVRYRAEAGAQTLVSFDRTVGCSDDCSPALSNLIKILNYRINEL